MGRIALHKVLGDLRLARGRVVVLVLALAVSLTAVGAVLGAYGILAREMPRSFLSSRPASATLVVHPGVDQALLDAVRQRPGVADADRRGFIRARAEVAPDRWFPLRVFVVDDFPAARVETVSLDEGAWPPTGAMLIDRTSVALLETRVGAWMKITSASGQPETLQLSGVVFDGGVAPAWQEQTGSAYVTAATAELLGETAELDMLKVVFDGAPRTEAEIERRAHELSVWLAQQGVAVEEIQIPPPGQHPHQGLMNMLASILLLFSVLALALSALLVATMVSAMLSRHVQQIGSMKAIGAQPSHVVSMYATMVLAIGAIAVAMAIGPAVVAGQALADAYAELSNVELASRAISWRVLAVVVQTGLVTPLLAAAAPVIRASEMTIREAISEVGLYQGPRGAGSLVAARVAGALGPTLILALRHAVRRRGRLFLSLILLAAGGGAFMSGLNVAAASDRQVASGLATIGYDVEIGLRQPQPTDSLLRLVRGAPGVEYAEPIGTASVAFVQPGEAPVTGTHKDGGHGSLRLYGLAPETRFRPAIASGRWLEAGDLDAIVVSPGQGFAVGETVSLAIAGRRTLWRVVGVMPSVRGPGGGPGLYVTEAALAQVTSRAGTTDAFRVVITEHQPAARQAAWRALERALSAQGIGVADGHDADRRGAVVIGHMAIVQGALQTLGLVLGVVGALTLASAMSLSVVERTREFGVMQTIGATPGRVIWVVVAEALFVGALSYAASLGLALLLSWQIGSRFGNTLFGGPLPLVVSPVAALAWLAVALLGSAAASALPARSASRLTIRETLAHV